MSKFAPGATPADILNPPPPAFARAPPRTMSYAPFAPCSLLSLSKDLAAGFPPLAPPAATAAQPHPFAVHDVQEGDWTRFLGDMKRAGALSPMNRIVAGVAPMAMGIGLAGACCMVVVVLHAVADQRICRHIRVPRDREQHEAQESRARDGDRGALESCTSLSSLLVLLHRTDTLR